MGYSLVSKWLFWVVFVLILFSYESKGCIEKEKFALLQIKKHLISNISAPYHKYFLSSWSDEKRGNCCLWERVRCDVSSSHIIELSLSSLISLLMDYDIPVIINPPTLNMSVFQDLEELQSLDLSSNVPIKLVIDEGLCNLKRLQVLDLSYNFVPNGSLPKCIGNLSSLKYLDLSYTYDFGNRKPGLCRLTKLEWLGLNGNLSSCVGNLISLRALHLDGSDFIRTVPSWLCKLVKLENLSLRGFHGSIPNCIGNLTHLEVIDLTENQYTGTMIIPSTMSNITNLVKLSMRDNSFEGKISLSLLSNNAKLAVLEFDDNDKLEIETEDSHWIPSFQLQSLVLTGSTLNKKTKTFPTFLSHQYHLQHLDISRNDLVGLFPISPFQDNLLVDDLILHNGSYGRRVQFSQHENISSSRLRYLNLDGNKFSGKLPENIGLVLSNIRVLYLSGNNFEGQLPNSICEMKQLNWLDMSNNYFEGKVPERLFFNSNLQSVSLSNNNFNGRMPLKLDNYHFNESIEESFLKSFNLETLDLSYNRLSGGLPSWIGNLRQLQFFSVRGNIMHGQTLSTLFSNLSSLFVLDISRNKFSGTYLNETRSLNLSHNKFNGSIPKTLSMLSNIESLDLSYNNLSGPIPSELVILNFLEVFNVSYNNLSGGVPTTQQFATFDESSYLHNPFLYGYVDNTSSMVPKTPNATIGEAREKNGEFDWGIFFWSFGSSCFIFLLGSILMAYNNLWWLNACLIFIDAYIYSLYV